MATTRLVSSGPIPTSGKDACGLADGHFEDPALNADEADTRGHRRQVLDRVGVKAVLVLQDPNMVANTAWTG